VTGVSVDLLWGLIERDGPLAYDWAGYRKLLFVIAEMGFKIKASVQSALWLFGACLWVSKSGLVDRQASRSCQLAASACAMLRYVNSCVVLLTVCCMRFDVLSLILVWG
jgi:hypothetical protein